MIAENEQNESFADALRSAVRDAQELVRSEIALAKTELRQEVSRLGVGASALAGAAVAGLLAVVFVLTALALGVAAALAWPVWTGFALVGVLLAVGAVGLAYMGRSRLTGERHMPLTVDTLKENLQWMRARMS